MIESLVPVAHSHLMGGYRVPMWVDDEYKLCVGKGEYRIFTDETLPDEIKAILSMIRAFPKHELESWEIRDPYMNQHDRRLDEVGWQVTNSLYMLVLQREFLDQMRFNNDT